MDALIMAAGRGSRLGEATDERPKSLVDLGGVTPLEWQVDLLASRGVARIVVVTGYHREQIEAAVTRRAAGRVTPVFCWNPFWSVTNVIGSAWMASAELRGPFVYLHADTVFEPSILDDLLARDAEASLPVDFRECEPEQMKATVIDGHVTRLSKELPPEETAGEFIGIGAFRSDAIEPVRRGMDAVLARGGLDAYFEAALNHAIDEGLRVAAVPTDARAWTEIDFPEDLELARRILPKLLA